MTTGIVGMSTAAGAASATEIYAKDIKVASGVPELNTHKKQLVGSVLDLFSAKPTLYKLDFWRDDAHFEDPITTAKGRDAFAAQWYGLAKLFTSVTKHHEVTKNEERLIEMDLEQEYSVAKMTKLMKCKDSHKHC